MLRDEKAKWEMGNCTDPKIIYLSLKGRYDTNYRHFHLSKEEAKMLINDLQTIVDDESGNIKYKITKR